MPLRPPERVVGPCSIPNSTECCQGSTEPNSPPLTYRRLLIGASPILSIAMRFLSTRFQLRWSDGQCGRRLLDEREAGSLYPKVGGLPRFSKGRDLHSISNLSEGNVHHRNPPIATLCCVWLCPAPNGWPMSESMAKHADALTAPG